MKGWWGLSFCVLSFFVMPIAHAESRVDSYDKPDVEINRSVLQELKDYTPPPMFSSDPPTESEAPLTSPPADVKDTAKKPEPPKFIPSANGTVSVEDKGNGKKTYTITRGSPPAAAIIPPPERPSLTAPKAEDILSHPVENFHVLTIQQPALTQPDPKAVKPLPVPDKSSNKVANKQDGTRLTIIEPPKKPKVVPPRLPAAAYTQKPKQKMVAPPPLPPLPLAKVTPQPYVPKTAKSMPAVGAVKVDKTPLPPMPVAPMAPPSSSDRILDAALENRMVEDTEAVKGAVIAKPDKSAVKSDKKIAPATGGMSVFSLAFSKAASDLTAAQKTTLKQNAINPLQSDGKKRVGILAYASSADGDDSAARRTSLARALAVREYLVNNGIPPARIDLKALGDATTTTPKDRVDIKLKEAN